MASVVMQLLCVLYVKQRTNGLLCLPVDANAFRGHSCKSEYEDKHFRFRRVPHSILIFFTASNVATTKYAWPPLSSREQTFCFTTVVSFFTGFVQNFWAHF